MVLNVRRRRDRRRSMRCRVWLNGREVTRDCWYADGRRGIVRCYERDAEGRLMLVYGDGQESVYWQEHRGRVRIQVAR